MAPGPLKTSFFHPAETDENIARLKGMSVNGDIGDPDDDVPVVRFPASPEARWVTAQTVYVNGGLVSPAG
ncbi:SDR family oxidoreductase [Streptomyces sp. XH2]|uniref:SDR family oxidoreductase n=1 Tax=Streptomyces sp. XH2 TaxID=3412483 RepID=UPI003C7E2ACE